MREQVPLGSLGCIGVCWLYRDYRRQPDWFFIRTVVTVYRRSPVRISDRRYGTTTVLTADSDHEGHAASAKSMNLDDNPYSNH
jgi:hypothetical protein